MKRRNIVFVLMIALVALVAVSAIVTLTMPISAEGGGVDTGHSGTGKWDQVCCGTACEGGVDYCVGNGTYVCCK